MIKKKHTLTVHGADTAAESKCTQSGRSLDTSAKSYIFMTGWTPRTRNTHNRIHFSKAAGICANLLGRSLVRVPWLG